MNPQISLDQKKAAARGGFEALRQRAIEIFEAIERDCPGPYPEGANEQWRFETKPWLQSDHSSEPGGGGATAMLNGRVFEKIGVHASTVFGKFAPEFAKQIPGAELDPRFWASGTSLIAHPWNPNVPAAHMNTASS